MKKLVTIICLFLCSLAVYAQSKKVKAAKFGIATMNGFYRISKLENPVNSVYPIPDSASASITVICQQTLMHETTNISLNDKLDYQFNGNVFISCTTVWWKKVNGVWIKKSQLSQPTICLFGLNPSDCYKKQ